MLQRRPMYRVWNGKCGNFEYTGASLRPLHTVCHLPVIQGKLTVRYVIRMPAAAGRRQNPHRLQRARAVGMLCDPDSTVPAFSS